MQSGVFVKQYKPNEAGLAVNEKEVWRYSGYYALERNEELDRLWQEVLRETKDAFVYRVCYRREALAWDKGMPCLPFPCESKQLAECLKGSREVVIFAATVGIGIDRLIAKCKRFSPAKALLMQAYGAERVESLCNLFCSEMADEAKKAGVVCTARFSPGYGDLPLKTQTQVVSLLDCARQIGISLNDSLLMTPSKSVTAIFGIREAG